MHESFKSRRLKVNDHHHHHILLYQLKKSAMAQHSIDLGHSILLNTSMLVKKSKYRDLLMQEVMRIHLHLNMNQVDDFSLSRLWTYSRKGSRMFSPSTG